MRRYGILLLCTAAFFCGGCMQGTAENENEEYAAHADARPVMHRIGAVFDLALSQQLRNDSPGGRAGRKAFLKRYCCWKFSGIGDLQFVEESSRRVSRRSSFFENRWTGRFDPAGKGLLPGILGAPQDLTGFPAPQENTLLCGAAVIDFSRIGKSLRANLPAEWLSPELVTLASRLNTLPPSKLFFELRYSKPDQRKKYASAHLCWEVRTAEPAPELFSALSAWAEESGAGVTEGKKIMFGSSSPEGILECDAAGRLRFTDGRPRPAGKKEWNEVVRILHRVPAKASLLCYLASGAWSQAEDCFFPRLQFGRLPFTAELLDGGGVFALNAGKAELSVTSWMTLDLYGARLLREALLPMIAGELLLGREIFAETARLTRLEEQRRCGENLREWGTLLQEYAKNHQGRFPAPSGAAGLKLLFSGHTALPSGCPCNPQPPERLTDLNDANVPYLYFGGFKTADSPEFPLLLDRPGAHRDCFNVLLCSGKVLTVELENPSGARRMVSALQSRFRYPEKDLALLLKKAEELDLRSPPAPKSPPPGEEDEEPDEGEEE